MSTMLEDSLGSALFSPGKLALLGLLFSHPGESFYLRQIAERTGLGLGQVQRETDRLARAGIVHRSIVGRHVFFRADPDCPIYDELRGIVRKTAGAAGTLRAVLRPLSQHIRVAFIFGSMARGEEHPSSDIDLMAIGSVTLRELSAALRPAEDQLRRPINPSVYTPQEFAGRLAHRHHFLTSVLHAPRIFVLGDEHELRNLSSQRLDQTPPVLPRRNRTPAGGR